MIRLQHRDPSDPRAYDLHVWGGVWGPGNTDRKFCFPNEPFTFEQVCRQLVGFSVSWTQIKSNQLFGRDDQRTVLMSNVAQFLWDNWHKTAALEMLVEMMDGMTQVATDIDGVIAKQNANKPFYYTQVLVGLGQVLTLAIFGLKTKAMTIDEVAQKLNDFSNKWEAAKTAA